MPHCPNCGVKIGRTANFCKECGFDLKGEEPRPEKDEKLQPEVSTPEMKCAIHPERDAVGVCVDCGKGVCTYCKTTLQDNIYCPSCVDKILVKPIERVGTPSAEMETLDYKDKGHDPWIQSFLPLYKKAAPLIQRVIEKSGDNLPADLNTLVEAYEQLRPMLEFIKKLPKPKRKEFRKIQKAFEVTLSQCIAAGKMGVKMLDDLNHNAQTAARMRLATIVGLTGRASLSYEVLCKDLTPFYPECKKKIAVQKQEDSIPRQFDKGLFEKSIEDLSGKIDKYDAIYKLAVAIGASAFSSYGSIRDACNNLTDQRLTPHIDFAIRTEMFCFFLHMMDRYAFSIGGPKFRDNLQDEILEGVFKNMVESSFNVSSAKKGFDKKAWLANMMNIALEAYNEAGLDYANCKEFGLERTETFPLSEETILGKLAARITRLVHDEYNVELRLHTFTTTVAALVESLIEEQVEEIYRKGLI